MHQLQSCTTRNNKRWPSGRRKTLARNLGLHKGIWATGTSNYVGKYKDFFFLFKYSKYKELFKAKTIAKYCEGYHISRNKMFDNDSIKAKRGELKVDCVLFLYYVWSGIISFVGRQWKLKEYTTNHKILAKQQWK